MKVANSFSELVGNTPLLRLNNFAAASGVSGEIIAKIEYFSPTGSIKDRTALALIEDGESKGLINKDTTIIECTSGNTGIGLAAICAYKGYKLILVMPDTMSSERVLMFKAFGAQIVSTPGAGGIPAASEKANELAAQIENSFQAGQFVNLANPRIHELTTGPEIIKDTDGHLDGFVATIGTGGTITGISKVLKEYDHNIYVAGVEPASSPMLTKGIKGPHKIAGIGAGFVPFTYSQQYVDAILTVTDEAAAAATRLLAKTEGVLVGISSGAALAATTQLLSQKQFSGKRFVVILPDTGQRYLSTDLFESPAHE